MKILPVSLLFIVLIACAVVAYLGTWGQNEELRRNWELISPEDGHVPRPDLSRIQAALTATKRIDCRTAESMRLAAVYNLYRWGAFAQGWSVYAPGATDLTPMERYACMVKGVCRPSRTDAAASRAWLSEWESKARDRALTKGDIAGVIAHNDLGLGVALSLVFLDKRDHETAAILARFGVFVARVSLELDGWDGVDHGRDTAPNVTAHAIILLKVSELCRSSLASPSPAGASSIEAPAPVADKMKASFLANPQREELEREHLEALWALLPRS